MSLVLKWGIVSTGHIAGDFCNAVQSFKSDNQILQAVGARDVANAKKFAERFNIPSFYGSYDELFNDPNVNIVYVASINLTHRDICLKAIEAGKHVLCEKPMTLNLKEQEDILRAAKAKNVFFMEALWTRFFPIVQQVKKDVEEKRIGELKFLTASFMAPVGNVERITNKAMGGGAILDIGIYPIQFACNMFNHEKPIKITATGHLMSTGVDESCTITLLFSNQRIATLNISISAAKYTSATLIGDKGVIEIPEHAPSEYFLNGVKHSEPLPECQWNEKKYKVGLRFQAEAAREAIAQGLIEHPVAKHDHSRLIMEIMEEANKQLGNVFE